MIDQSTRAVLFAEVHRSIAESVDTAVAAFGSAHAPTITYPPGESLTEAETAALRSIVLTPEARSAVRKLVAEACSYPMFHLFSLFDGVSDPDGYQEHWPGLALVPHE